MQLPQQRNEFTCIRQFAMKRTVLQAKKGYSTIHSTSININISHSVGNSLGKRTLATRRETVNRDNKLLAIGHAYQYSSQLLILISSWVILQIAVKKALAKRAFVN